MVLRERLNEDLKAAMKSGDDVRKRTVRGVKAAVTRAETRGDEHVTLDDEGILAVIAKEAKQRRESIVEYERAGRKDLVAEEQDELTVLEGYLPQPLSREEIRDMVQAAVAEVGAAGPSDLGKVMKILMPNLRGRADGKIVQQVVRELLNEADSGKA